MTDTMRRYIVLGRSTDIDQWRRDHGLPRRQVVAVSTMQGDAALRGLSGDFDLVVLGSWSKATPRVRRAVDRDIHILRHFGTLRFLCPDWPLDYIDARIEKNRRTGT